MSGFNYETRSDFVSRVRRKFEGAYTDMSDEELYQAFTDKYPEYKSQIAENYKSSDDMDGDLSDPNASKKNFFTGLSEVFSRDFYKYVPFVRDAEIAEVAKLYDASKDIQRGTATDEQVVLLKEWLADEERPTTWGYKTFMIMAQAPAFFGEILGTTAFATMTGGAGAAGFARIGGVKAGKEAAEAAAKKAVKGAVKKGTMRRGAKAVRLQAQRKAKRMASRMAGNRNVARTLTGGKMAGEFVQEGVKKGMASKGVKATTSGIKKTWQNMGSREFARRLSKGVDMAKDGTLKKGLKAMAAETGEKQATSTAKYLARTLGVGVGEAAMMAAFRAPQTVLGQIERMMPEMRLGEGLDNELLVEILDDGDDWLPALAKAYLDQGIEFFSENVGDSLFLAHHLWGKEVLRAIPGAGLAKSTGKLAKQETAKQFRKLGEKAWVVPLKMALINAMKKAKPSNELAAMLKKSGFNGTLGEMFEERVGDVLRASTGLQDHWLPDPSQLASEAVAFSLFGAGSAAAVNMGNSVIAGGAGFEARKQIRELMDVPENSEERVQLESEIKEKLDAIIDLYIEQEENPSWLVRNLRKVHVKGWTPLANLQERGSVDEHLQLTKGQSLTAIMASTFEKTGSREEALKVGRDFLEYSFRNDGIYRVQNEEDRGIAQKKIREGMMTFVPGEKHVGYYMVDADGWTEQNAREEGILVTDVDTYNKLSENGTLSGVELGAGSFAAKPGSPEAEAQMDNVAQMFNWTTKQQARDQYEMLHEIFNAKARLESLGIELNVKHMAPVVVKDKGSNIRSMGYRAPKDDATYQMVVNARTDGESGEVTVTPFALDVDTFEDLIETVFTQAMLSPELNSDAKYSLMATAIKGMVPEELRDYGDVEILSKGFMAAVLGISRGRDADLWNQIEISEENVQRYRDLLSDLIGEDIIHLVDMREMVRNAEQEEAEEVPEPETTVAPKESEAAPVETIEEAEVPFSTEAPVEVPESTDGLQALTEAEAGEIEGESLRERLTDVLPLIQNNEKATAFVEALIAQIDADIEVSEWSASEIERIAKSAIDRAQNDGISFSVDIRELDESSSEEDVLAAHGAAAMNDYLRGQEIESKLSKDVLTRSIKRHFGSSDVAIDYLYQFIKIDIKDGGILSAMAELDMSAPENIRIFINYLQTQIGGEAEILRKGLSDMFDRQLSKGTESSSAAESVFDIFKSAYRRYQNIERLPVYGLTQNDKGKWNRSLLNADTNVYRYWRKITTAMDQYVVRTDIPRLLETLKLAPNAKVKASQLAIITGLGDVRSKVESRDRNLFDILDNDNINKIHKGFISHVEGMIDTNTPEQKAEYLAGFFLNTNHVGSAPLIKQLLIMNGAGAGIKTRFVNSEGNQEMGLRQTSHLTEAAKSWAKTIGIPQEIIDSGMYLSMFSGARSNNGVRKNAKDLHGEERTKRLLDLFDAKPLEINGRLYYWQSVGQMGGKNQVYQVLAPYHRKEHISQAIQEYEQFYGSLSAREQSLVMPVRKLTALAKKLEKTKGRERLAINFELHKALNSPGIFKHLHGDLFEYSDSRELLKRASQIPTGGVAWRGKKLRILRVKDIEKNGFELFDGQSMFAGHLGPEFAQYMGRAFMGGNDNAASIKPNISFIANGQRKQIKGAWKNLSLYAELPGYNALNEWLENYNAKVSLHERIDAIVPTSSTKVGFDNGNAIDMFDSEGNLLLPESPPADVIEEIDGEHFITVQNFDYDIQPELRNEAKQKSTDLIHGINSAEIARIAEETSRLQIELLEDQDVNILFSQERGKIRDAFEANRNDISEFQKQNKGAFTALMHMIQILQPQVSLTEPVSGTDNGRHRFTYEVQSMIRDVLKRLEWAAEADAVYFESVFQAIKENHSEHDPAIVKPVQAMKARFIQHFVNRKFNRAMALKSSAGFIDIPDAVLVDAKGNAVDSKEKAEHTALPWIITNVPGVRAAMVVSSKTEAKKLILEDPIKYSDMIDPKGNARLWEVRRHDGELWIPGGIVFESRIPGENMQSHIPHRLWKPANSQMIGNISITPNEVAHRKGEDFDGDMGYQFTPHEMPRNQIEANRNKQMLLQMESFTRPEYFDAMTAAVDPGVFGEIAKKYELTDADREEKNLYLNSVEGEAWDSETNSTAFDSLSIIASNIKFYDIAQALGFSLKAGTKDLGNGLRLHFSPEALHQLSENKPFITERKRFYGTALINIAVDDLSHQQMHSLGLNEITSPIAQALLALDASVGQTASSSGEVTKAFQSRMTKIVEYLHAPPMQAYTFAKRQMRSLEFNRKQFAADNQVKDLRTSEMRNPTNEEVLVKLMNQWAKENGFSISGAIGNIKFLDAVVTDITAISQIMDTMYESPESQADLIIREAGLEKLLTNNFKMFDVGNASVSDGVLHPHLSMIQNSVNLMNGRVFNGSAVLSEPGRALLTQIGQKEPYLIENKRFLDHFQKELYRGLAVRALSFQGNVPFDVLGSYIIDQLAVYQNENPSSMFYRLMGREQSVSGSITLKMHDAFIDSVIPDNHLAQAKAEFDSFPESLKQALALYATSVYGPSMSNRNGSFMMLIGDNYRKKMSDQFAAMIDAFNKGEIEGAASFTNELHGHIMRTWPSRYSRQTGTFMPVFTVQDELTERLTLDYYNTSPVLLAEMAGHADLTFIDLVSKSFEGTVPSLNEFKIARETARQDIISSRMTKTTEEHRKAIMKLKGLPESHDFNPKSDGSTHSLVEMTNAMQALSPMMMAGARGVHKVWFNLANEAEADRVLGRVWRVRWESAIGLRSDHSWESVPADQKQRAIDLLSAVTAKITGQTQVVLGSEIVEMPINEAVKTIWDLERNRYNAKELKRNPSGDLQKKVIDIVSKGQIARPSENSTEAYRKIVLENDIRAFVEREGKSLDRVPVRVTNFDPRTVDEIIEVYENARKLNTGLMSANSLIEEVKEQFEAARKRANSSSTVQLSYIHKRDGYMPLYFHAPMYREGRKGDTYVMEASGRSHHRTDEDNSYNAAAMKGQAPLTTSASELFELWNRDIAHDKHTAGSWQLMLLGQLPDGSPLIVPHFDEKAYESGPHVIPKGMIDAFAKKLAFSLQIDIPRGVGAMEFINTHLPESDSDFTKFETGLPSMPVVYARNDETHNLVKMAINQRKEGKLWKLWEGVTAWTKFMAIGFPYMSFFHYAALLESQIAIGGLKESSAWTPFQHYKDFQEYKKALFSNPEILRKWMEAGLEATIVNPDYQQGVVADNLRWVRDKAKSAKHNGTAKAIDGFMELKEKWDSKLWVEFHAPLKLWTAEGLLNEARKNNPNLDEAKAMREISALVDSLYGGINDRRLLWKTPETIQILNAGLFARDWTEAALGIAGAGNIRALEGMFGEQTQLQNKIRYGKYWPAFLGIVMFGIPNAIQAMIWALTRPFQDDDDLLSVLVGDDVPFTVNNEHDRSTWIDVTPALELLPFYQGDDTGARKIFIRWGKQGYEIGNWLTKPVEALGHKTAIPIKWAYEHMSGKSVGGWDMAFKDQDFFGVMQAHGSFLKGRVGDTLMRFTPFTVQDILRGKPTAWFTKAKQGKHGWYASKQLTELYLGYVNDKNWKTTKNHEKNILVISGEIVRAAASNGFDPVKVQKDALQNARAELYMQFETAMKRQNFKKAELIGERLIALEASAVKIKRLLSNVSASSGTR